MTAVRAGAPTSPSRSRLPWLVVTLSLLAGCASHPPPQKLPPVAVVEAPTLPSDFTLPAGEPETWNAIGQLLVRLPGVTFQGRSQRLGLYAVDYQGESFLVLTHGVAASAEVRTLTTQVRVALQNGATDLTPQRPSCAARFRRGCPPNSCASLRCRNPHLRTRKPSPRSARGSTVPGVRRAHFRATAPATLPLNSGPQINASARPPRETRLAIDAGLHDVRPHAREVEADSRAIETLS